MKLVLNYILSDSNWIFGSMPSQINFILCDYHQNKDIVY